MIHQTTLHQTQLMFLHLIILYRPEHAVYLSICGTGITPAPPSSFLHHQRLLQCPTQTTSQTFHLYQSLMPTKTALTYIRTDLVDRHFPSSSCWGNGFTSTLGTSHHCLLLCLPPSYTVWQPDLLCDSLSDYLYVAVSFILYSLFVHFSVWPQYLTHTVHTH